MSVTYKDSGVDIDAGNALVKNIAAMVKQTRRAGVASELGGFGGLFDLKAENFQDPILVSGTDGVGTKLKIAIDSNCHTTIGIDLVAMCANDVLVQGAEPLFFLDYFATGRLNVDVASDVISGITQGCLQAGCALLGGETAEMPGFYPDGHYDLAGFCVGAVERANLLPLTSCISDGDLLIGLPSSGFHSNGFSLVRKVAELSGLQFQDPCPWKTNITFAQAVLEPTVIYVKQLKSLLKSGLVYALSHITGGGLTENIPRVMPDHLKCHIDLDRWDLPECFKWVRQNGSIASEEMLKTFNCGIGMVLVVSPDNLHNVQAELTSVNQNYYMIGTVQKRLDNQDAVCYGGTL